jgi:hypothetical protein
LEERGLEFGRERMRKKEKQERKAGKKVSFFSFSSFPLSLLSPHTYRVRLSRVPALEICCGRELRF